MTSSNDTQSHCFHVLQLLLVYLTLICSTLAHLTLLSMYCTASGPASVDLLVSVCVAILLHIHVHTVVLISKL